MYSFVSAIAKPLNGNGRWVEVDIGDIALHVLFATYSRIIATLTNPFLTDPVALELEAIRADIEGELMTFNQFLTKNGAATLPTSTKLPVIKPRYARYADAFHAKYKVEPVHPTAAADAEMVLSDKTWLRLTRPDTDYSLFYKSCLINVNGFFHQTDAGPDSVYVKDGMKSAFLSRENQIGIVSFRELGELSFVPITADMVYKQNERQAYKDRVYIDLGMDVSDKTVMLVLGGYLHALDRKTFYRVSESSFAVDFGNLPFLDRYYESKKYIDLSSLPLQSTDRNPDQISVAEFFSDENILAYLTLSQSFFVVLDNPDIFVELDAVEQRPIPDMYVTHEKPIYPMVIGAGRIVSYWYTKEDGQYSLTCFDTLRPMPLYDTIDPTKQTSVSSACDPERPYEYGSPFFLKIGTDLQ